MTRSKQSLRSISSVSKPADQGKLSQKPARKLEERISYTSLCITILFTPIQPSAAALVMRLKSPKTRARCFRSFCFFELGRAAAWFARIPCHLYSLLFILFLDQRLNYHFQKRAKRADFSVFLPEQCVSGRQVPIILVLLLGILITTSIHTALITTPQKIYCSKDIFSKFYLCI